MESKQEFVKDWQIVQTLGEGAYGEVKLLVHGVTGEAVAVKIIDLIKHKDAEECVRKEVCIHKLLNHQNIIKFFGRRQETNVEYLFLEYAAGGELFNKIEPDVGMACWEAQKYMKQLLAGVEYLHQKGIAHRDIKPENILLDDHGDLKISDFGMATIFRFKGKERLLDKKCGTLPYIAPEVIRRPYQAEPADIWSCGIVFVAMLSGELPWDQPTADCAEYLKWRDDSYMLESPWCKLDNLALGLARKILYPTPQRRPKLRELMEHRWMQENFKRSEYDETDCKENASKRLCLNQDAIDRNHIALSQPTHCVSSAPSSDSLACLLKSRDKEDKLCFSQPTQNDDLLLGSQLLLTQSVLTQDNFHRLVKRMTRFYVKTDYEQTVQLLCLKLEILGWSWNSDVSGMLTICTTDCRKMKLVFKINVVDMNGRLLVDFRLSKGCGLEFKKKFVQMKTILSDIVTS